MLYHNNKDSDFHQTVADMAKIPRTQAKTINLGLFYGMGKVKLQAELGVTKERLPNYLILIMVEYPLLNNLWKETNRAQDRGQIRTFTRQIV